MKKMFAFLIALLMVLPVSGLAVDAVSSATVSITEVPETTTHEDAKTLVIWFSTNDTVKAVALTTADALEADSFEIVPEQPYTEADLAYYTDGRCDKEQADASARPAIVSLPENLAQYDVIFIGYPIWHGQAPKILYTLLESIDLSGKTIVPFCTSMSSGAGSSADNLAKLTGDTTVWMNAARINNNSTAEQVREWALSALEEATK
jgi:flavodoxin